MTEVRAPLRVDLAGGWTDLAPYTTDYGGEVVNFTINKYVHARLSDTGEIKFEFDVPAGSGLGASGALNVAKIALQQAPSVIEREEIAEAAYQLEISSGNRCGRQDQWASALGGFNRFMFLGDVVEKMPFEPARSARNWLRKHLIIAHSGISHKSGEIQEGVWSRYESGDLQVIEGLKTIRLATRTMIDGLQRDQRHLVVEALNEVCRAVDMIDPSIHEPFKSVIDPLMSRNAVMAWKALGAGAGGCAALLCHPMQIESVHLNLSDSGWEIIDWDYDELGIILKEN